MIGPGCEILATEGLSLEAQMKVFRQAKVVVSPTGANATNLIWCQPNTSVVILASDHESHQLYFWKLLAKVSNCHVEVIQGPRAYEMDGRYGLHDDYSVDINLVLNTLSDCDKLA